ncbi:MAG: NADH-quinone oxidoreductase subunit NuoK [Thermodesulfobacteriota bacterium]|jgi:NADH-quinone oxidoreductase subunit K
MIVPLGHIFLLAGIVFSMGLVCLVARRNLIMTLIGVEVMMNAAAIAFIAAALRWKLMEGQAFVLFILAVSAAEISLGLALIVSVYRRTGSIDPDRYDILKW